MLDVKKRQIILGDEVSAHEITQPLAELATEGDVVARLAGMGSNW